MAGAAEVLDSIVLVHGGFVDGSGWGVTTVDTHGRTPGHMPMHIGSFREEMLLTGDVVVDSAVSFLHPKSGATRLLPTHFAARSTPA